MKEIATSKSRTEIAEHAAAFSMHIKHVQGDIVTNPEAELAGRNYCTCALCGLCRRRMLLR
jgi:hypothetical protein